MNNFEAFNIYKEHKYKLIDACRAIFIKCNIPDNKLTQTRFRRNFKTIMDTKIKAVKRGKFDEWVANAKNEIFCKYLPPENVNRQDSDTDYFPSSPKRVKYCKSKLPITKELGQSAISRRVKAVMPSLQAIADSENTTLFQLLIIVLVKICKKLHWATLAKLLHSVFITPTDINQDNELDIENSSQLLVSQELGRDRYQNLRNTLVSGGFGAKPWYKVNAHCNTITPVRIPVTIDDQDGVIGYRFNFKDACTYIVNRSFVAAKLTAETIPDQIYIAGKDGTDGSGQHYRRAQVNVAVKGNNILYRFTPLYICAGNTTTGHIL